MAFVPLSKGVARRVNNKAQKCVQKGKQRVTPVMLVQHCDGRFLFVYGKDDPVNSGKNPGLPKGGMKHREHVLFAGMRELEEETGILPSQIKSQKEYGGSYRVPSLKRKGGFSVKRYFVFHVIYDGPLDLRFNTKELSGYRWVTLEDVEESLRDLEKTRPEKYHALMEIFSNLKKKIPSRT